MIVEEKVDQTTIRTLNKMKIINLIRMTNGLTKRKIAKTIGVSIPTVISNVNELIREGIAEEAGLAESTGGRKPVVVRFIKNSRYSFGVDFLVSGIRIILTNLCSDIIKDVFIPKAYDLKDVMSEISLCVKGIMSELNIPDEKILGIGFSLPGTVSGDEMILETSPNLGLKNIDFKRYKNLFNFPMFIENEANVAAYAELQLGAAKGMDNLVYISLTEGVGTGIIIQSRLYKGNNRRAGEFGHMTVEPNGRRCTCGKLGCWHAYVSLTALVSSCNEATGGGINSLKEFIKLLEAGDAHAACAWKTFIDYLAIGMQNIIFSLDPQYIVIGGEIANYGSILIKPLTERIFKDLNFFGKEDIRILVSKLKENSSILGASLIPMERFLMI